MDNEIDVKVIRITPDIAEEFLGKNNDNRKMRKLVVQTYAKDMSEGRWEFTHQGIAFDCNGNLIDGQHRLAAIIESGMPQNMIVTRNVVSRVNIDNHIKRNLNDITGYSTMKLAMTRIMLDRLEGNGMIKASNSEVIEYVEKHLENLDFAEKTINHNKHYIRVAAVRAAIFAASYHEDSARLMEFGETLCTGRYNDYDEDSAAIVLKERLTNAVMTGIRGYRNQKIIYLRTEGAIKRFCNREKVLRSSFVDEIMYPVDK